MPYIKVLFLLIFLTVIPVTALTLFTKNALQGSNNVESSPVADTESADFKFESYTAPTIDKKDMYTIVMIGDSMTHALGPHGGTMNSFINDLYKNTGSHILINNYAQGAKNILQAEEQLTKETKYAEFTFPPLLSSDFDLILIESFGYNPLSHLGIEAGLIKQTETLDLLMTKIIGEKPNARVVFVASIAPNRENYALNVSKEIRVEERIKQAEERMTYIENHIEYARLHNIPVVNIYQKSQDETGSGNLKYINPTDFIHPSHEGIDFIGREIAAFVFYNNILPTM